MSMVSVKEKDAREFAKQFLNEYLADGFGALPKREIDILVMNLLLNYAGLAQKSNQELSILLQVTESKIRHLRYEAHLKYPPDADYVKREFLYILARSQFDFDREKVVFVIEDDFIRHAIQGQLKVNGMFADTSFNTELVRVDKSSLEAIIRELYGREIAGDFHDGFKGMEEIAVGIDAMQEFRAGIVRFVMETLKTLGYEYIKSRIGL